MLLSPSQGFPLPCPGAYAAVHSPAWGTPQWPMYAYSPATSHFWPSAPLPPRPATVQHRPAFRHFTQRQQPVDGPQTLRRSSEACYPHPAALHDDVVANDLLFHETLRWLNQYFGTRCPMPEAYGVRINLHQLYSKVTQLGGLEVVIAEKLWPCVYDRLGCRSPNASFKAALQQLYIDALFQYEQVYFHVRKGPLVPYVAPSQPAARRNTSNSCERKAAQPTANQTRREALVFATGANILGGYDTTFDLPDGRRTKGFLQDNGVKQPAASPLPGSPPATPARAKRCSEDVPGSGQQSSGVKRPRLSGPPTPPLSPFDVFSTYVDKKAVLQYRRLSTPGSTEADVPQVVQELWEMATPEQLCLIETAAAALNRRHGGQCRGHQESLRASSTTPTQAVHGPRSPSPRPAADPMQPAAGGNPARQLHFAVMPAASQQQVQVQATGSRSPDSHTQGVAPGACFTAINTPLQAGGRMRASVPSPASALGTVAADCSSADVFSNVSDDVDWLKQLPGGAGSEVWVGEALSQEYGAFDINLTLSLLEAACAGQ